jgi:hypothetical protein
LISDFALKVDGSDLVEAIRVFEPTFDLEGFALEFGRNDCL